MKTSTLVVYLIIAQTLLSVARADMVLSIESERNFVLLAHLFPLIIWPSKRKPKKRST